MAKEISKERVLALLKILFEKTDDQQGLTLEQILGELESMGISAERKALYRDFEALRKRGISWRSVHFRALNCCCSLMPCREASSLRHDNRQRSCVPLKAWGRSTR